jgi:hypothetical protein
MVNAALLGAIWFAGLPIRVEAGNCPSAQDLEQRLARTLPARVTTESPDVAHVFKQGDVLQIELVSPDAALIAERSLPYVGSCVELADMVAVILASWESDVHPEFARAGADSPPVPVVARQSLAWPARPAGSRFDLVAGVGVSLADSPTFAGIVAGGWFPRGAGLGLRLWGAGESRHTLSLGAHDAEWRRWLVGAALDWRRSGPRATLDLHGGPALAILQASGVGYDLNQPASSAALAVALGVRVSVWASARWAVTADLTGCSSLRSQFLRGSPGVDQEVPKLQGFLTLGLAANVVDGESAMGR